MKADDVAFEIGRRIHALKVAINRWEGELVLDDHKFQQECLDRWHIRRQCLQDLENWYRAEVSRENRERGHYDGS